MSSRPGEARGIGNWMIFYNCSVLARFFGDFPFLEMQAVRMQDVAHPVDSDCKGFDSNIVLAPQRCTYIIEGTFRTAESATCAI